VKIFGEKVMSKIIASLFLMAAGPSLSFNSDDSLNSYEEEKKYTISLCAVFKDESNSLKEWIDYHYNLGVDHFFLYNLGDKSAFYPVLKPYMREGIVTLVNWPVVQNDKNNSPVWALSTLVPAYENAVNFVAKDETKWLAFIDVNEFLVCPEGDLFECLRKYDSCAGLLLSSNLSGKDRQIKKLDRSSEESSIKMIFKPDQCAGFVWPPYECRFKPFQSVAEVSSNELCIHHIMPKFPNEISSWEKGLYQLAFVDYIQTPQNEVVEELFLEDESLNWSRPLYPVMPDFLKKLFNSQKLNR